MERIWQYPRLLKAARIAGYVLFFVAVLAVALPLTFPTRQLKGFLTRQAQAQGYPLAIESLRLTGLSSVEVRGVALTLPIWPKALAAAANGNGDCPRGATRSAAHRFHCTEAVVRNGTTETDVYGPFGSALVNACLNGTSTVLLLLGCDLMVVAHGIPWLLSDGGGVDFVATLLRLLPVGLVALSVQRVVFADTPVGDVKLQFVLALVVAEQVNYYHYQLMYDTRGAFAYLRRHGEPRTLADLSKHNCLAISSEGSQRGWTFREGGKNVTIKYHSPSMKGRKIFGGLEPFGKVWRAGANEATALHTDADIVLGDLTVPAGDYTLFVELKSATEWNLIVSKETGQWGLAYKGEKDLGRTKMKITKVAPIESYKMTLTEKDLTLAWEETSASVSLKRK